MNSSLAQARLLAFVAPALLLGGALASEYLGGLYPCEMCYWQRWPHEVALVLALFAFVVKRAVKPLVLLAALAIAISGAIGVFHAGVEYRWWEGVTTCTAMTPAGGSSADILKSILTAPVIRCDQPQWTLAGISLAGFNAIFSFAAALVIWVLATRKRRGA